MNNYKFVIKYNTRMDWYAILYGRMGHKLVGTWQHTTKRGVLRVIKPLAVLLDAKIVDETK